MVSETEQNPLSLRLTLNRKKKLKKKMLEKASNIILVPFALTAFVFTIVSMSSIDRGIDTDLWAGAILMFTVLLVIEFGCYYWYFSAYIKRYFYDDNEDFLTIRKGIFTPREINVRWQKMQDVYVDQDLLDRMLGIYDVHISSATATSGVEAHIDGVDKSTADQLKELFFHYIKKDNQMVEQSAAERAETVKVVLQEPISSDQFPLKKKWFTMRYVSIPFNALILPVVFAFFTAAFQLQRFALPVFVTSYVVVVPLSYIGLALWKKHYRFEFLEDGIYWRTGMIGISEQKMPYPTVQNVMVVQGLFERLFQLYSVEVENAQSRIRLCSLDKDETEKIVRVLEGVVKNNTGRV